jgi:hypothetical protein
MFEDSFSNVECKAESNSLCYLIFSCNGMAIGFWILKRLDLVVRSGRMLLIKF